VAVVVVVAKKFDPAPMSWFGDGEVNLFVVLKNTT